MREKVHNEKYLLIIKILPALEEEKFSILLKMKYAKKMVDKKGEICVEEIKLSKR